MENSSHEDVSSFLQHGDFPPIAMLGFQGGRTCFFSTGKHIKTVFSFSDVHFIFYAKSKINHQLLELCLFVLFFFTGSYHTEITT